MSLENRQTQWSQFINIIKSVVTPAQGCTEPVSVAFASASVRELLGQLPEKLLVRVSENLFKNAMGVVVPGTADKGLLISAAAGAVAGKPELNLEVLKGITEQQVVQARQMISEGRITVETVDVEEFVYCEVIAEAAGKIAEVVVAGGHTLIAEKRLNGEVVCNSEGLCNSASATCSVCEGIEISIRSIYEFATQIDVEDILFMNEAARLNGALSSEGLETPYGLQVGRTMQDNIEKGLLSEDLINRVVMCTSAASDARMGGATLPAMSNYGSGNQGIVATIPVMEMARFSGASDETLARALAMSHLMAIYIKSHYPPLSAFCGNTVTSSASAFAMTWLSGGSYDQCCYAMQNVMSDCCGMICDGAKASCAMKVATSVGAAVRSSLMAMSNAVVKDQGIIGTEVEQTIQNVGQMIRLGMAGTDKRIIQIMTQSSAA